MVISYYPGAGGNRYYKFTNGAEYETLNMSYDTNVSDQKFVYRYLQDLGPHNVSNRVTLTHCLNVPHIKAIITNHGPVVVLKSNMKKSLRRQWQLMKHVTITPQTENHKITIYHNIQAAHWPVVTTLAEYYALHDDIKQEVEIKFNQSAEMQTQDYAELDSAWQTIVWHHDYYQRYIPDFKGARVIDIDTADNPFAHVMRQELDNYSNALFDTAWECYYAHGKQASIFDYYKNGQ